MQQFKVVLKNYKIRSYRLFAFFLLCFNLAIYFFLLITHLHFYELIISSLIIFSYCIFLFLKYKKDKQKLFPDASAFFVMAGCWLLSAGYFIAVGCIIMGFLYHFASQKIVFIFYDEFIKKMNFPQATYSWEMLANVILHDDILTLDFNNNKLIQSEIEDGQNINEQAFNIFAKQRIASVAK